MRSNRYYPRSASPSHVTVREFAVPSSAGGRDLHCVEWVADEPIATLQIAHGMAEHIGRYGGFAGYLNGLGISVVGHDHLGHGLTCPDSRGTFAASDGDEHLIEDMYLVTEAVERRHPGIPHMVMGHSMGSYVVRRYLTRYGDMVDGAIVMGTGQQSPATVALGRLIADATVGMRGPGCDSALLGNLVIGRNDRGFDGPDMPNRWLSRDPDAVAAYNGDPLCGFGLTASGYRDLLRLIGKVVSGDGLDRVPKGLPILLVSGSEDPVGGSRGVARAKRKMEKAGLRPEMVLYEGARHEVLNDLCRDDVYRDLGAWIVSHALDRGPGA